MEPRIQYAITSDGVSIAYAVLGSGPVIVFPSNIWGSINLYKNEIVDHLKTFDGLVSLGWSIVTYDGRGCGSSDRNVEDYTIEGKLRDLEAVIVRAAPERFAMCGMGQAGPAAIAYTVQQPRRVTHLILSNTFARGPEWEEMVPAMRASKDMVALAKDDWEFYTLTLASGITAHRDADLARKFADAFRSGMTAEDYVSYRAAVNEIDLRDLLSQIAAPTLVVHDRSFPAARVSEVVQRLARLIAPARFVETSDLATVADEFLREGGLVPAPASETASPMARPGLASGTGATIRVPSGSVHTFAAGRYTVVRTLGEGAQKTVYLVHDTAIDRHCALALLKTEAMDADGIFRIKREAQAMGSLTHPNIVIVYDVGEEAGRPYIVCEYMPGGDLQQELRRAAGPLPLDRTLAIGQEVCRALAAAHQRGITHRDVKPGNIWLMEDGGAKLGDFGLAVAIDRSRLTMAGTAMGTAAYMAPEQAQGQPIDARTDLYSLGCLLYELATGRPPFIADDPIAVVSQHIHASPKPPSQHNAQVSRDLEQLVLALLAKAKDERPSSAEDVLIELKRIAAES